MEYLTKVIQEILAPFRMHLVIAATSSLILFVATPLIIPLIIREMRVDFFLHASNRKIERPNSRQFLYYLWHVAKNILGLLFILTGIVLLFVPGQGVLTIFAGIIFMDFPGKHRFIKLLTRGDKTRRALNWIRRKEGKPEFIFQHKID